MDSHEKIQYYELIIRIYTEAKSENEANKLSKRFIDEIEDILKILNNFFFMFKTIVRP